MNAQDEIIHELLKIVPATPLEPGMERDLVADIKRLVAKKYRQAEANSRGMNGCFETAPAALRYLAKNPRPAEGQATYNAEHLLQIAGEIEKTVKQPAPPTVSADVLEAISIVNECFIIREGTARELSDEYAARAERAMKKLMSAIMGDKK